MREVKGDLWEAYEAGVPICVTTNAMIKKNGLAVMGAGIALQAAQKFPKLPEELGKKLFSYGNHVYYFEEFNVFTFPTKRDWKDKSTLELIRQSALELVDLVNEIESDIGFKEVALPRPGCLNGGLDWNDVKQVLDCLDDRFVVVTP